MKRFLPLSILLLSGCAMTPEHKSLVGVGVGILAIALVSGSEEPQPGNLAVSTPSVPCRTQPDGSCR